MFPLFTKNFPPNAEALRLALEESLRRVFIAVPQLVTVEDKNYPELAAIQLTLDGAKATPNPPRPVGPIGTLTPALRVEHFEITGRAIDVQGAAINLSCVARNVRLGQGRDGDGNIILQLQSAADGKIEIGILIADLEAMLLAAAQAAAAKEGLAVDQVQIYLRSRTTRSLEAEARVRARKLFLSATVRVTARVEIDEQLNARLSGVGCTGEGTLGSIASNFLQARLAPFNDREFPLLALPLGEAQLREVQISVDRDLSVTARFGVAPA